MKIITVCGMGMGISLMVLIDIQAIAKKNNIVLEGEAMDLSTANGVICDLAVASKEIAGNLNIPEAVIIPITNIIDKKN